MKKGSSISVERRRRQVATAIGGDSAKRMRIDAVETAEILTSITRFGGKPGRSTKAIP
jgi:hypothetical protein